MLTKLNVDTPFPNDLRACHETIFKSLSDSDLNEQFHLICDPNAQFRRSDFDRKNFEKLSLQTLRTFDRVDDGQGGFFLRKLSFPLSGDEKNALDLVFKRPNEVFKKDILKRGSNYKKVITHVLRNGPDCGQNSFMWDLAFVLDSIKNMEFHLIGYQNLKTIVDVFSSFNTDEDESPTELSRHLESGFRMVVQSIESTFDILDDNRLQVKVIPAREIIELDSNTLSDDVLESSHVITETRECDTKFSPATENSVRTAVPVSPDNNAAKYADQRFGVKRNASEVVNDNDRKKGKKGLLALLDDEKIESAGQSRAKQCCVEFHFSQPVVHSDGSVKIAVMIFGVNSKTRNEVKEIYEFKSLYLDKTFRLLGLMKRLSHGCYYNQIISRLSNVITRRKVPGSVENDSMTTTKTFKAHLLAGVIDLDVKASSGIPEKHYVVDEVHKFVDEFFEVIGHEDFAEMYKVGCYYQQGYFELSPVQFLHLYKNKLKEESDFDNVIMASSHVYAKSIVKDAYHIVENFGMMSKTIRLDVPLDTHLTNEGIKVILTDLVEGRDYAKHRGIIFMKAFDRDLRFLEEKQTE